MTKHKSKKTQLDKNPKSTADAKPAKKKAKRSAHPNAVGQPQAAPAPAPVEVSLPVEETTELPLFADLGLTEPIARAITEMGFETPTPIQARAVPLLLA